MSAADFIDSALKLHARIAVFDCDGTLWWGDAGADFFYWELERGIVAPEVERWIRPRYEEYKAGKVDEAAICGEMVTIHEGLSCTELVKAAEQFFADVVRPRIFPEMQELTMRLAGAGTELWAVSSTNEWVVRAGVKSFGIAEDHVLAACVQVENEHATGRLIRVPTDGAKETAIREVIGRHVDAAFGNSIHDEAMLTYATHAFAINPNADLARLARERDWCIYYPGVVR